MSIKNLVKLKEVKKKPNQLQSVLKSIEQVKKDLSDKKEKKKLNLNWWILVK